MPPPNDKNPQKKKVSKGFFSKLKDILATKERLKYLYKFGFVIIVYGVLLNFTSAVLFAYPFNFKYLLAMGIGFYFIKEELPRIIGKSFPPRL